MLTLFCALVDVAGSPFSIDIDETKSADHLKDAIKKKNEDIRCPARKLELFLAKKGAAWLDRDGAEAVALGEHGHPQGFVHMDPLLWINNTKYFGQKFDANEGEIHVLVVVPPQEQKVNPRLLDLQESLLYHVLIDSPSSTSARTQSFEVNLCKRYQCNLGNGMVRCMLLDIGLPSELVAASHLFRRKNAFLSLKLMRFNDTDDVKNGLLLFKSLEHAFGHFQISFIYDKITDQFHLKILDQSLRQQRLFGHLDQTQRAILLQGQNCRESGRKIDVLGSHQEQVLTSRQRLATSMVDLSA